MRSVASWTGSARGAARAPRDADRGRGPAPSRPARRSTGRPARRGVCRRPRPRTRLALENHGDLTADELERLVEQVGDLRVCFDTANALRVGDDVAAAARRLAPAVEIVHLKDCEALVGRSRVGPGIGAARRGRDPRRRGARRLPRRARVHRARAAPGRRRRGRPGRRLRLLPPRTMSPSGLFDLSGRRALVTGGGGGIGLGIADALAGAGATVAILSRSEVADEAAVRVGGTAIRADVSDRRDLRRGFEAAVEALGGSTSSSRATAPCTPPGARGVPRRLGRHARGEPHLGLRAVSPRRGADGAARCREDRHDRVDAELPGRIPSGRVQRLEGRRGAAHEGPRERMGAARGQRQRDRARLREDAAQPAHLARRPGAERGRPRAAARRAVGRAAGSRGSGRVPRLPRLRLRARHRAPRRRGWLGR